MSASDRKGSRERVRRMPKRRRSIGDEIIQGLREAIAFERGELANIKITRREIPAASTQPVGSPRFNGKRVARLRERLRLSQPVFAQALNVSAETVKKWEQDAREPDGAAVRLLEVAEDHPEWLLDRLRRNGGRERP